MTTARMLALGGILGALLLTASSARAQNQGFDINRYQPTPAGEWSFMVDHPWYSKTRFFAAGITLDYAHNPLLYATADRDGQFFTSSSIVAHQLIGSLDLAGSFLDRVNISVSIPLTLLERGEPAVGVAPIDGVSIRDPSASLIVRLYGQPDKSPFSISIGATVWFPLRSFLDSLPSTASDLDTRILPKLVLGGLSHHVRWSFVGAFLYRPSARLSASFGPEGNVTDHSVQFGAAIAYASTHFAIGPELRLNTIVTNGQAFGRNYTSLEALIGAHYNIADQVQIGAAIGLGALREPGTPDVRALFRLAYAPIRKENTKAADRDSDGILDKVDACPDDAGPASADPAKNGCPPPPDRDRDGVIDAEDRCVDLPMGPNPDPARKGCPLLDKDGDGVFDSDDQCVETPAGPHPDPARKGCPLTDKDGDGVYDNEDQCVEVPAGPHPDPQLKGCPDRDNDNDGVLNSIDQCKDVPQGLQPDPQRLGCPAPDRDGDTVPDAVDACPDKPGAPSPNPKKNGCPGLVEIQGGLIKIYKKVYFKLNKADIDVRSNELLASVAHTLTVTPAIKKVEVAGFADDTGDRVFNQDLTERRSQSVVLWLTAHGVAAERLYGKGYGAVPIDKTLSKKEQAKVREFNRRVEFRIVDPPQPAAPPAASPPPAPAPAAAKPAAPAAGVKKKAAPAKAKAPAPAKKPAPAAAPAP